MSKVLFIEPNVALATTYVRAAQYAGYEAAHAHTAQEAISVADALLPEIVLLEFELPGHDGVEFVHEFRSYPEWLHIPILLLTNMSPDKLTGVDMHLREDLGIVGYLYKPQVTLQMLIESLRMHTTTR